MSPITPPRVVSLAAVVTLLALVVCCFASLGDEVLVPVAPGDDTTPTGDGTAAQDASTVPTTPEVPDVPGEEGDQDVQPPPGGEDTRVSPVETLPPKGDAPFEPLLPDNPLLIVLLLVVFGVMAAYVPGEVRRMRIESAMQDSMDARLALARGEFVAALAGFDRAIEQAHQAYTRRHRVQGAAEWVLLPDRFYIGLWRGRAAALMGMGRVKSAVATQRLAGEMEAMVYNGHE